MVTLHTTYFGPVQWYQQLYRSECVYIDRNERWQKQTIRNRCYIATANGVQALSVPIVHKAPSNLPPEGEATDPTHPSKQHHFSNSMFEKCFLSYELHLAKPQREIFEAVLQQADIKADETLFIDDSLKNCQAAEALGIHTYHNHHINDWLTWI